RSSGGHGGGGGGGGGSYGGDGGSNNGFIQVSQQSPSQGYGAPPAPASNYGAPTAGKGFTGFSAPPAPSTGYKAPAASTTGSAAPGSSFKGFTPVAAPPSSGYSAPGPAPSPSGYSAPGPAPSLSGYSAPGPAPSPSGYSAPGPAPSPSGYSAPRPAPSPSGHSATGPAPSPSGYSAPGPVPSPSGYSAPRPAASPSGPAAPPPSSYSALGPAPSPSGYTAPTSGSGGQQASATGYRAPASTGTSFGRAPASVSSYSGSVSRPLRNSFPTGPTGSTGSSYSEQQQQTHINAPLSAAMAMGHLLNEDEVVKTTGETPWRPLTGTRGAAPSISALPSSNVDQTANVPSPAIRTVGSTEEPLFINLDDALQVDTVTTGNNNIQQSSELLLADPVTTDDGDTYLISATEEYDDFLLVDQGSPDAAAKALAKVADAALIIEDEPQGRSISGSRPQENVLSVGQTDSNTVTLIDGRGSDDLQSGQESNMMFAALMEELNLTTLTALIRRANLEAMLTTEGGFTIFAPSDSAFTLLPRSVVSRLQNNTDKLREVVLFHVIPGVIRIDDLTNNDMLNSASPKGRKLRVNVFRNGGPKDQVVTVNGARIKRHDMLATNGVIHVIDRVLYPMADLSIVDHLSTCETFTGANVAVTGAGLTPVLEQDGPFTVFLPTTDAFAAIDNATVSSFIQNITLLQHVLMYHIVPGAYFSEGLRDGMWLPTLAQEQELQVRITTDGYSNRLAGVGHTARVIKHDIIATNGVIHVIDTVLRPETETPICGHF
ncbi:flocculation protein FLO11-like, partial [Homarus americanus]|uniref:flocculation protein FLO11-like n=1 Tax=Homarus americanus TaxID=6706 RepID=UPI001C497BB6